MAFFAFEITVTRKKIIFLEASDEDQAFSDWRNGKGEEVWSRNSNDPEFWDSVELTKEDFENKVIPEKMK